MKTIRNNVFETNSSSTHSISINENLIEWDSIESENDTIILTGGEFGWGWQKYNDALTKANYCAVILKNCPGKFNFSKSEFKESIKEVVGVTKVKIKVDKYSYVDHNSIDNLSNIYNKDQLKNFIFNKRSWLFLGNDNDYAPNNFYDDPYLPYTHKFELFYNNKIIYTKKLQLYPDEFQINNICEEIYHKRLKFDGQDWIYDYNYLDKYYEFNPYYNPSAIDFINQTLTFTKYENRIVLSEIITNYQINETIT